MKELIDYLLRFGNLNLHQIELVQQRATETTLKKNEYFSEAGKIARQFGFIIDGVFRVCYYNNKGEEITRYFVDENNFIVDLNSYNNNIPSSEYVQAITDARLVVFSREAMNDLSLTIVGWDKIINQVTAKALIEKVNRISPMMAEDAKSRYISFLDKFPNLVNRIPLSLLASYLGVTQSSLSRIRREVR